MNFLKIAKRDISAIFKNRFIRVSVVAIVIVPLLYSLLYLYAFWDPYSKLSNMPVAVVNMDKGGTKDGKDVNYGKDVVDKLKDNNKVGWRFVDYNDAKSGVEGKKYYAMFVIPDDFTKNALTVEQKDLVQPKIYFTTNDKRNFLASQINGKVVVELKAEITKSMTKEVDKVLFDNLYETKDKIQLAADGSKKISDGNSELAGKIPEMKDGVGQLANGASQLKDGLAALSGNVPALKDGTSKLYDGSTQLQNGLATLRGNIPVLKDGAGKLYDGSTQLQDGLATLNGNVPQLKDGIGKLVDGSTQMANGINTTAVDNSGNPVGLKSGLNALTSGLADAKTKSTMLTDGVSTLYGGAGQIGTGVEQLYTGVNVGTATQPSLKTALTGINDGINQLAPAIKALNDGVNISTATKPSLKDGISKVYYGVVQDPNGLCNSVARLNDGVNVDKDAANPSLKTAVSSLHDQFDPSKPGFAQALNAAYQDIASGDATKAAAGQAILAGLCNQINLSGIQAGQPTLKDGLDKLYSGVVYSSDPMHPSLSDGISALNTAVNVGTDAANPSLNAAITGVYNGITSTDPANPGVAYAVGAINNGVNVYVNDANPGLANAINSTYNSVVVDPNGLCAGTTALNNAVNIGTNTQPSFLDGMKNLKAGTDLLVPGMATAYDASSALYNGAIKLGDASTQITNGLVSLNNNVPALADGTKSLYDGSIQLRNGLGTLNTNIPLLADGTNKLYDGSAQLRNGLATLNSNVPALADGANKLYDGSLQLNDGLSTLNSKMPDLLDGATKLKDGSKELSDKLADGSKELNGKLLNDSDTMSEYLSQPVDINQKAINEVKTYGAGFAPYFISLSLWVGVMLMFFVITEEVDEDIKASSASLVLGKFVSYGIIGIVQAVLASAIVVALGLRPANMALYFLFNVFSSLVFIAIVQSLVFLLGQAGRLLSIVLLILQLTACAGTFPLEVVPKFFKVLNPFMPFTYTVEALRELISGVDYSIVSKDASILAAVMVTFVIISVLMKGHADRVKQAIQAKKEVVA